MKYEETLRRHVLAPLVELGIPQDLIATRLGIDPGRLSKIVNDRPEVKPLTVEEIEVLHQFVSAAAAVFVRAVQLTALPTPVAPESTPPPAIQKVKDHPPPAEQRRRSRVR